MRHIAILRPHAHPPRKSERDLLIRLAREGRAQDRRERRRAAGRASPARRALARRDSLRRHPPAGAHARSGGAVDLRPLPLWRSARGDRRCHPLRLQLEAVVKRRQPVVLSLPLERAADQPVAQPRVLR